MIRVLLVDDQALVRSGFRIILDSEPGIEVVGEAANGAEGVALARSLQPDVICMDVEMPTVDGVVNGIDASRRILTRASANPADAPGSAAPPAILVLTTFGHEEYLFDALAAGVSGFLLKSSRAEHLIDAVRVLAAGGSLLGPEVTGAVLSRVRSNGAGAVSPAVTSSGSAAASAASTSASAAAPASASAPAASNALAAAIGEAGLTTREQAVFALLAGGLTNAEIAADLFLGEATVKTHVSNVLQKLGVRDRLQAVVWAHTRN